MLFVHRAFSGRWSPAADIWWNLAFRAISGDFQPFSCLAPAGGFVHSAAGWNDCQRRTAAISK
jgi:hypothetical protein